MTDDSAAHVSEEVTGAARAAPLAIMIAVGGTQLFGWLVYIAASFATASVPDLITTTLPLPLGQLFLNVIGKHGMLALWSCIIVVQVRGSRHQSQLDKLRTRSLPQALRKALMPLAWSLHLRAITLSPAHDGGSKLTRTLRLL
jgi:hypothetical protein